MLDIYRSRLGPDLVFVILNMDMEEVKKRVKARHHGDDQANEMMEVNIRNSFRLTNKKLLPLSLSTSCVNLLVKTRQML